MTILEHAEMAVIGARNTAEATLEAYKHLRWSDSEGVGAYAVQLAFESIRYAKDAEMFATAEQVRKARKSKSKKAAA